MSSDPLSAELTSFLEKALGIQLAEPDQQLTEETLKGIARKAGLTEEDWEKLCEKLQAHLAKGRNFLKFANYTDAIIELEHAVAIAPYRADVLLDCGKAHSARWKETKARPSRDRAESLFNKCLEVEPDNAEAAEQLSTLKRAKSPSRAPRKVALFTALFALVSGVSAWVGIQVLSGTPEHSNLPQIGAPAANTPAGHPTYPPATLPPIGERSPLASDVDLVAHWAFDSDSPGEELAPAPHPLTSAGLVERTEGIDGSAMRFFPDQKSGMYTESPTNFELVESITVSAWVKPATRRGGQIVWFGDRRVGRDPWQLTILGDGRVRFRTDRSVTSKPTFPVRQEEIVIAPDGAPDLVQQVAAESPGVLPLNEWSFVTGRIEKVSANESVVTVFVNGTAVSEARTHETVHYETERMWIALGAVHYGDTQNFNGTIDEVRVYRSALSADEIREIYRHPRRNEAGEAP